MFGKRASGGRPPAGLAPGEEGRPLPGAGFLARPGFGAPVLPVLGLEAALCPRDGPRGGDARVS